MKVLSLLFVLVSLSLTGLRADAPTYGKLRVVYDEVNVYEGASARSKIAGTAKQDQEFELRGDKLYDGFYKIQYGKKICFVMGSQVKLSQALPTSIPTAKAEPKEEEEEELVVQSDRCQLKKGSSDDHDNDEKCQKGQRLVLKDKKIYNGYYKCELKGRTVYVKASECSRVKKGEQAPKIEPTKVVTSKISPIASPVKHEEEHEQKSPTPGKHEEEEHEHKSPTTVPTVEATEEPTATAVPTKRPTLVPTPVPTEEATELPAATAVPTKQPTLKPTAVPTEEATEQPVATAVPTRLPTLKPTAVPTEEARELPAATVVPTRLPTAVARPTVIPTTRPTEVLWPTAVPTEAPSMGRGRRRKPETRVLPKVVRETRSGGAGQVVWKAGSTVVSAMPERDPHQLAQIWLYMPLGMGKHLGNVKPAFKPDVDVADIRYIESSAFLGIGMEVRLPAPWLRMSGDWTYFTHRTKAADQNKTAYKVGLPPPGKAIFADSDVYYQMNTHAVRLGLKASVPGVHVEPWINGTVGAYVWNAEYLSGNREWTYGGDTGLAFGATVGTGIDFHLPQAHSVITITPFLEWGAPTVNPSIKNVADIGQDWKDSFGTIVAPESRFGLQLAIGF